MPSPFLANYICDLLNYDMIEVSYDELDCFIKYLCETYIMKCEKSEMIRDMDKIKGRGDSTCPTCGILSFLLTKEAFST
jgi:hypothetical protein